MADTEDFEAAGLYDAATDSGTGRLELLRWLDDMGFSIAEMVTASTGIGLGSMPGDRRLLPGDRLSNAEAKKLSGLDDDRFEALATAFGIAAVSGLEEGELGLTPDEVKTLEIFDAIAAMFTEAEALGFVRVVGTSLARLAEAALSLFLTDVESPHLASAGSEYELGRKVYDAVGLLDEMVPRLDPILRRHVFQGIERSRKAMIDSVERIEYRYAVGFVDLVGFTPISNDMSARDLASFIRDFEGRASDAVTLGGARLVKLIGDEIMFVAPDADSACQVASALMTSFATAHGGEVLPRGGLAYGDVIVRGGDYYGSVVNMASRLVDEAVPRELLVSSTFADAADCLEFEPAGRRMLKGFSDPVSVESVLF